ncbi:succinylglutamate desuccinylase/aspartoacylase family protein [Thermoproteota archaeon]
MKKKFIFRETSVLLVDIITNQIKVGNIEAKRGEIKKGSICGLTLPNGSKIDIPIIVVRGIKEGPTLLLTSTEHGIEIQGIEVILKILREEIDPAKLNGTVIGVPVMNPLAFFTARYRSWVDHQDISRVRADNPNGSATEILAHKVWTEVINIADIWINMHCNVRKDSLLYTAINTSDPRNKEDNIKLAKAFGYTTIYSDKPFQEDVLPTSDTHPNSYRNLAAKKGIPYILVEYIDGRWISEPSTSTGIRGTLNVMKTFDMIEGDFERQKVDFPIVDGINRGIGLIRPKKGGLVRFLKKPGVQINKNEVIAEIYNLYGEVIEKVVMPEDGYIWAYPCGEFDDTPGQLQVVNSGCGLAYAFINEK